MIAPAEAAQSRAADAAGSPARRLRVALVISSLGGGGAERVLAGLANHLGRAGHDATVVTSSAAGGEAYALEPPVRRVALDVQRPSRSAAEGLLRAAVRVRALRRALRRAAPDVVVSFLSTVNVLTLLAAAGTGVPVVVCERTDPRSEPLGRARRLARRGLYPRAAAVVVQTERAAAWARTFCGEVHVLPNWVARPSRQASPGAEEGPRRIVALGRLGPEKGFDLLVEAFARVAPAHPGWTVAILGEGPERPRLEARVAALGLRGRVLLPGRVADPEGHLAAADLFVLPSRREGFPNALLEAMACGLPAVAADCASGPAEIVTPGEDGILVPPEDAGALAAAMSGLMARPAERVRLGHRARDVADRLAPARVLARWDALLLRCARPERTSP